MAKVEVLVVKCDKCGFEDRDTQKFLHVTITSVVLPGKYKKPPKPLSERDLCESCVGLPGVNRDKQ